MLCIEYTFEEVYTDDLREVKTINNQREHKLVKKKYVRKEGSLVEVHSKRSLGLSAWLSAWLACPLPFIDTNTGPLALSTCSPTLNCRGLPGRSLKLFSP